MLNRSSFPRLFRQQVQVVCGGKGKGSGTWGLGDRDRGPTSRRQVRTGMGTGDSLSEGR